MTERTSALVGSPRAQLELANAPEAARLYRLDGGYVVLSEAAAACGADVFESIAADWNEYRIIAITGAPDTATEPELARLGRAAQAFDRIVICQSEHPEAVGSAESAARFARAVRRAGRTECHVAADAQRALRHCIDAMIPGDVIAYCCDDAHAAAGILAEYGALPVQEAGTRRARWPLAHTLL